ncbi:hypothetical protein PAECIP111891_02008 [Paenibacillus allorhizoplanae]|uniref:YqzM family protein n=1 Tax=Paenibacillus allorhizoplanae TaxID=2905648 RepID=A0ABM9C2G6_9BACL|nr:hypothetical protein PAECIP111891_02008 [Paenibacillus allorhizoplanae]
MNKSHSNNYEQKLDGLLPLTIIFFLSIFSGFFFFLINHFV